MSPQRLLSLFVALILYASLYPFHFDGRRLATAFETSLWGALSFRYSGPGDTIANLAAYVPIGIFARLCLSGGGVRDSLIPIAGGTLLSIAIEIVQIAIPSRNPSLMDVLLNVAGTSIGVALANAVWLRLAPRLEAAFRSNIPTIAILLALVWVAMHAAPFIPVLGMHKLRAALSPLKTMHWAPQDVARWMAAWIIFATILRVVTARIAFPLLFGASAAMSIGMTVLFLGHSISWNEIIGLVLATPFALLGGSRLQSACVCAGVLISGLAPFQFQETPARFGWIPFVGFLESDWGMAFRVVFEKGYLYAGAVWILFQSGLGRVASGVSVATLLTVIEWMQRYLPGRSPEVADPIIALLAIMLLEGKSE